MVANSGDTEDMAKIKDVPAARTYELSTVHDVVERYQLDGPHASVVMLVPTPGEVGDDLTTPMERATHTARARRRRHDERSMSSMPRSTPSTHGVTWCS